MLRSWLSRMHDEKPYGVRLKAQPDSDRLGKRLKGEFKKVAAAITGE